MNKERCVKDHVQWRFHVWNGKIFDHTDCSWLNITTPHWSSRRKFFSWVIEPFEPADGGSWDPGWGWKATNGRFAGSMQPRVESELPASWFKWLLQRTKDRAKHFGTQLNSGVCWLAKGTGLGFCSKCMQQPVNMPTVQGSISSHSSYQQIHKYSAVSSIPKKFMHLGPTSAER